VESEAVMPPILSLVAEDPPDRCHRVKYVAR